MAGFPKTGKMAIYNIQLFGKGGEVLVYKLNGKQHAYAESIPKEQLVDEVTKSDNICYYRSNTPLFLIHDAVDMEDCIIKINEKEFLENGWKHRAENVIVTKASKGCWYNHKDYPIKNPSDVRDVSGAGDTFLAAFSYSYTATKNVETAIIFSQDCCQRVIRKKGVTTI